MHAASSPPTAASLAAKTSPHLAFLLRTLFDPADAFDTLISPHILPPGLATPPFTAYATPADATFVASADPNGTVTWHWWAEHDQIIGVRDHPLPQLNARCRIPLTAFEPVFAAAQMQLDRLLNQVLADMPQLITIANAVLRSSAHEFERAFAPFACPDALALADVLKSLDPPAITRFGELHHKDHAELRIALPHHLHADAYTSFHLSLWRRGTTVILANVYYDPINCRDHPAWFAVPLHKLPAALRLPFSVLRFAPAA